jgi:hypothetical protein
VANGLGWQVTPVRQALGDLSVPIHSAVCFTSSEWGLFAKPFRHHGVLVTWASNLAETIAEAGDPGPEEIDRVANRLGERLKPAVGRSPRYAATGPASGSPCGTARPNTGEHGRVVSRRMRRSLLRPSRCAEAEEPPRRELSSHVFRGEEGGSLHMSGEHA